VRASVNVIPEIGISSSGVLVYLGGGASAADVRAVRVDRHGNASPVDPAWHGEINSLDLSPDGGRLVVSLVSGGRTDLWVKQLNTGPLTRLTFEGTLNYRPAWRPDGRLLSFTSDRAGPSFLYQIRADGSGTAERIMPGDTTQIDESEWSHDGRWLLYRAGVSDDQRKLYALGSDTSRVTLVASRFDSYMPTLSPDGRWLAYVSPESGREEVYVRPFPDAGQARWQVSTGGGAAPAWAHSGRELFYLSQTGQMISVEVLPGPTFRPGAQHALFALPRIDPSPFHRAYVVTPDDRAFIMLQGTAEAGTEETYLSVVLNWFDEVKARVQ
jgi:serine/threonine-protein kinase